MEGFQLFIYYVFHAERDSICIDSEPFSPNPSQLTYVENTKTRIFTRFHWSRALTYQDIPICVFAIIIESNLRLYWPLFSKIDDATFFLQVNSYLLRNARYGRRLLILYVIAIRYILRKRRFDIYRKWAHIENIFPLDIMRNTMMYLFTKFHWSNGNTNQVMFICVFLWQQCHP